MIITYHYIIFRLCRPSTLDYHVKLDKTMERQKMCIIFGTLIYLQTILSVRFYLPTNASFEANCQLLRISELNWIIIDIFNDVFFTLSRRSVGLNVRGQVKHYKQLRLVPKTRTKWKSETERKIVNNSSQTKLYKAWKIQVPLCHKCTGKRINWSLCTWISNIWYVFIT